MYCQYFLANNTRSKLQKSRANKTLLVPVQMLLIGPLIEIASLLLRRTCEMLHGL